MLGHKSRKVGKQAAAAAKKELQGAKEEILAEVEVLEEKIIKDATTLKNEAIEEAAKLMDHKINRVKNISAERMKEAATLVDHKINRVKNISAERMKEAATLVDHKINRVKNISAERMKEAATLVDHKINRVKNISAERMEEASILCDEKLKKLENLSGRWENRLDRYEKKASELRSSLSISLQMAFYTLIASATGKLVRNFVRKCGGKKKVATITGDIAEALIYVGGGLFLAENWMSICVPAIVGLTAKKIIAGNNSSQRIPDLFSSGLRASTFAHLTYGNPLTSTLSFFGGVGGEFIGERLITCDTPKQGKPPKIPPTNPRN